MGLAKHKHFAQTYGWKFLVSVDSVYGLTQ